MTAPPVDVIPASLVHEAKSMPAEESGMLPSVIPIVSHECYCRSAENSCEGCVRLEGRGEHQRGCLARAYQ